jgi:hypothetical protein
MDQMTSSSEISTDEESNLARGFIAVQDGMAKLANKVKRANKRIKKLENKFRDAQERASHWENLYKELKQETTYNKDKASDQGQAEDDEKPASLARAVKRTRGSNQQDAAGNKRNCVKRVCNEKDEPDKDDRDKSLHDIADTSQFDSLDEETKEWIAKIGLKNAYGSRDDGLERITAELFVGPPSFERIFLLVDFLYPVEENEETYHWRLFARETRPGIKVRAALRTIKKKNPTHPMVSWHKKGGQWIPPSVEALNGIVKLIIDL